MKNIVVGLLGFGTVGAGVAKILLNDREMLERRAGVSISLKCIVDLDTTTDRGIALPKGMLTDDNTRVLQDPEINTVIEVIGGVNPAKKFIEAALSAGKNVITSNKEIIAKHGLEFTRLAKAHNCTILYEAAVGGGIPVLHAVRNSLSANRIEKVFGIVNGTTNYILTKMAATGAEFAETLKEAQELGYAEANPKNDVEGYDAMYKLSIIGGLAFRCHIDYNSIYREGITALTPADFAAARQFGYTIKMLAIGINHNDKLELRVHPVMIENDHPLASVNDVFNAIYICGSNVGETMFYGRGAGELPTASAVVGDVMNLAFTPVQGFNADTDYDLDTREVLPVDQSVTGFFLRLTVEDTPGVLASLSAIFGNKSISIKTLQQQNRADDVAEIIILTHPAKEADMQSALAEAKKLACVKEISSVIRAGL